MPQFFYRARDRQGREKQGVQEAHSEEELIAHLQQEDLLVISMDRQEVRIGKKSAQKRHLHYKVSLDDLIIFTRQLATLLEAGVTLLKSLEVLTKQIESRALLVTIEKIKSDISSGSTFRDALARHPKIFSDFWVHMIETGEASGALPVVLNQLADYLESSASLRRKVTSAMIYPSILIGIAMVSLVIFTVFIIPVFAKIFQGFDIKIPPLTQAILTFSNLARRYFLLFFLGGGTFFFLFRKYIQTETGRWQYDRFKLKIPVLASLFQLIAIERFASGLGTLIASGVPILYSMDIISKTTGNKVIERALSKIRESVRQGKGMAQPLEESGAFTPMVVQMVSVGEEIGELSKMLKKVSEFYKERISTTITRVTTLVEPLVLLFVGTIVGVMVVSMFMPIFQIATLKYN